MTLRAWSAGLPLLCLLMTGCQTPPATQEDSGVSGELTPPTVTATEPAADASDVPTGATITATFSEPVNPETVTQASFVLTSSAGVVEGTVGVSGAVATFTPSAALSPGTSYTALLTTRIEDLAGNRLAELHSWRFTTAPVPDETPPEVVATTPVDQASGVPVNTVLTVTFDEPVDPATVTADSFTVSGGVTGAVTVSGATATFTPSSPLPFDTALTAAIHTDVTDLSGNHLSAAYQWSFVTGSAPDAVAPEVVAVSPGDEATDVLAGSAITLTFSEPMNPATIDGSTVLVLAAGAVAGTVSYSGVEATFTPASPLPYSTTFTVVVTAGARDLAGNPLAANFTSTFRSEDDTYPPQVIAVSPADGAVDVSRTATVSATFDEPLDPASIGSSSMQLGVAGTTAYDAASRTLTFTPASPLPWSTPLTARIAGTVRDSAGNALGSPYTWAFTTVADTAPPTVTAVTPTDGSTGVAAASVITVTFSEPLKASTLNTSTLVLSPAVPGAVTYSASTQTATFTPLGGLLPYGTQLTVTVTTAVEDAQGNALAAPHGWSFTTEADTVPPSVVSLHPIPSARLVSRSAKVEVTFDEAMDPASINSTTLSVAGVTGTVAYDPATFTASFIPTSTLAVGTTYTATLTSGARDAQGNALPAGRTWSFRTAANPVRISAAESANHSGVAVAFDSSGNAVAAWLSEPGGGGGTVSAATYSAASGAWSSETALGSWTAGTVSAPVVASDGTGFAVLYGHTSPSAEVLVRFYGAGSWSSPSVVATGAASAKAVVSNGSGYAASVGTSVYVYQGGSWTATSIGSAFALAGAAGQYALAYAQAGVVTARIHQSGSWGTETTVYEGTLGTSNSISDLFLIPGPGGFAAGFRYYYISYGYSGDGLYTSLYSGGAWTTMGLAGSYCSDLRLAASSSGYAALFYCGHPTQVRGVSARVYSGGSWGSATQLHTAGYNSGDTLDLVSNGTGYAAAWRFAGTTSTRVYSAGTWGTTLTLSAGSTGSVGIVRLASNGSGYATLFTDTINHRVYAGVYGGTSWSPVAVDPNTGVPGEPQLFDNRAGGYLASWTQPGAVWAKRHSGSAWSSNLNLVRGNYPGSASRPRVAITSSDTALFVWEQYRAGQLGVFARYYNGVNWGLPTQVAVDGYKPVVATNGSTFVVAWQSGTARERILVRRFVPPSTWDAPIEVNTSGSHTPPAIASNGAGYMVTSCASSLRYSVSPDGITWPALATQSVGSSYVDPTSVVSNGSSYLALVPQGTSSTALVIYSGGSWGTSATLSGKSTTAAAASNGVGYAAVASGGVRVHDGSSWGTSAPGGLAVGASGNEYAVLRSGTGAFHDGAAWSAPVPVPNHGAGVMAGTGAGYALLHAKSDGTHAALVSNSAAGGLWGEGGGPLDTAPGDVSEVFTAASDSYYYGAWRQLNVSANAGEIWVLLRN